MRFYKTPLGEFTSVTTYLDIIDKPYLPKWYADTQFKADVERAWEAYQGVQQFPDKESYIEYMEAVKGAAKKSGEASMAKGSWLHGAVEFWLKEI